MLVILPISQWNQRHSFQNHRFHRYYIQRIPKKARWLMGISRSFRQVSTYLNDHLNL